MYHQSRLLRFKMNSDKRMAELYLERDAGKKHIRNFNDGGWAPKPEGEFYHNVEYKLKPETLDEAKSKYAYSFASSTGNGIGNAFKDGAKWAWANLESKE